MKTTEKELLSNASRRAVGASQRGNDTMKTTETFYAVEVGDAHSKTKILAVDGLSAEPALTRNEISSEPLKTRLTELGFEELEFRRGYYLAVATLMRLHKRDVEAREVLEAYGAFDPNGIDGGDLKILRPLAKEAKRLKQIKTVCPEKWRNE